MQALAAARQGRGIGKRRPPQQPLPFKQRSRPFPVLQEPRAAVPRIGRSLPWTGPSPLRMNKQGQGQEPSSGLTLGSRVGDPVCSSSRCTGSLACSPCSSVHGQEERRPPQPCGPAREHAAQRRTSAAGEVWSSWPPCCWERDHLQAWLWGRCCWATCLAPADHRLALPPFPAVRWGDVPFLSGCCEDKLIDAREVHRDRILPLHLFWTSSDSVDRPYPGGRSIGCKQAAQRPVQSQWLEQRHGACLHGPAPTSQGFPSRSLVCSPHPRPGREGQGSAPASYQRANRPPRAWCLRPGRDELQPFKRSVPRETEGEGFRPVQCKQCAAPCHGRGALLWAGSRDWLPFVRSCPSKSSAEVAALTLPGWSVACAPSPAAAGGHSPTLTRLHWCREPGNGSLPCQGMRTDPEAPAKGTPCRRQAVTGSA